jgi:hypothetical protein
MKFTKISFLIFIALLLCCCQTYRDTLETVPAFKLIYRFSERIEKETGLMLDCYGINNSIEKEYKIKNGVANFHMAYRNYKTQKDTVSLEEARCLFISVAESFLNEINSDPEVKGDLDSYPFTSDNITISIYFVDENDVHLGTGISTIRFSKGLIKYEAYQILEYHKYPLGALGKDITIHQEPYAEALNIVKKQNCLMHL